jgi:alpha-amylase/alpha-mannosidase (GH57 family)
MYWSNFLHFYQPYDQNEDIVRAVVAQSYRPILEGLKQNPRARVTININTSLFELFEKHGFTDLIDLVKELVDRGQIELTGSAKYHTILPFLDESEIERQIQINNETGRKYLGDSWKPRGFFPPEMAFHPKLIPVVERMGFSWIILDEIACGGVPGNVDYRVVQEIENSSLKVFFRERRLSNLIMSAVVRTAGALKDAMKEDLASERYVVTAMDGETFGHHRPGLEKMLFEILRDTDFNLIQISEIAEHFTKTKSVMPTSATWASSSLDIEAGRQFLSWSDPSNDIHTRQKQFTDMVLAEVRKVPQSDPAHADIRHRMDVALASDQYFWASAKPWWSVEMIETAAYQLLDIARRLPAAHPEVLDQARTHYETIVSTAFAWQRSGKIREMMREQGSINRIPFKDRTVGKGGEEEGVYHAFIDMMKKLETKASAAGEYEKAILWRDAVYKLEQKHDIYDAINIIDLLRIEIPHEEVEATIQSYKDEYHRIRGGQPEQRGS